MKLHEVKENELYRSENGSVTLGREHGETPNGSLIDGRWVLRALGVYVDVDRYRFDLAERHGHVLTRERIG